MKKHGILNAQLMGYIGGLGHTDQFMIGDAGMPIPAGVPTVDLALCEGVPGFIKVLEEILKEVEIEKAFIAEEMPEANPTNYKEVVNRISPVEIVAKPHVDLKEQSKNARFAIRTGEFTSYSNVILQAGVVF